MQSKHIISATALAVISAVLLTAIMPMSDAAEFDRDYGTFYSYTLQFVFDGSDAESIEWDFGDGSPVSNEWNPSHTYSAKGEYIVTQRTSNSYDGGSITTERYRVNVAGFPVIAFESNGGSSVQQIEQTAYKATASEPADPVRTGYDFGGWFKDTGFENPMDWTSEITASMTLYAKWVPNGQVDPPTDPERFTVSFDVSGGSVSIGDETVDAGSEFIVPEYLGKKDGHEFAGWSIDGTEHQPGDRITIDSDTVLIAIWEEVPDVPEDPDGPGDGDTDPDADPETQSDRWYLYLLLVLAVLAIIGLGLNHRSCHRRP